MDDYAAYQLLVNKTAVEKKKHTKSKPVITKDEKIKNLRISNKIKVHKKSSNAPDPIEHFGDLVTKYGLHENFLRCFLSVNYSEPTPVQMQAIPVMLERQNILTLAPTGSGKTASFLIPIFHELLQIRTVVENSVCRPIALIISPTMELAKQTMQECLCLTKELDVDMRPRVQLLNKKIKVIPTDSEILICTPMKLQKSLSTKSDISISLESLRWLVVDESDKVLADSVNSFAAQFHKIFQHCRSAPDMRVALFSATQSPSVWEWTRKNLGDDICYVRIGLKGAAVDTVTQELHYCANEMAKYYELKALMTTGRLHCPCLIFLDRSDDAIYLFDFLREFATNTGMTVSVINGRLTDKERRDAISDFRSGKIHFLVCTNLLARGIDFKGVATVVNYDLPLRIEEYIHRIGRCGRAGHSGRAISLWTDVDVNNGLPDVMRIMRTSGQPVNEELFELVQQKARKIKRVDKGQAVSKRLKEKYRSDDGIVKPMNRKDRKRLMYVDNCVVRQKFLRKSFKVKHSKDSENAS